ncbi:helix-turn-helix domain-containing protein [Rhodococcus sp. P1Y]|uniref:helix-turn-helix domain-containing protein n=1 Tax=Rhodococcus sp. P1Y TaxID=1302308 RepID=UPI000EB3B460|nr:helix-turn-helix domain-containing protein [Rhodococcus sp. P1Y]AYJ48990.1 DNA-binding protein [Rhodococcus sp. P1Y]
MPEYFFTLDEVAATLKLQKRTIQYYISRGQLKAHKLGTAQNSPVRIAQADLDAFLTTQRAR